MKLFILFIILAIVAAFAVGCGDSVEIIQTYFPDGTIESKVTYVKGVKNGPFVYYNDKGLKWKEGVFINDSLDGFLQFYSSNGIDTSKTSLYDHGELLEAIDYTGASVKVKSDYKNRLITIYDTSGEVDTVINMK